MEACFLPVLRAHGYGPLPVNFLGKAATFNLLYAFPLLLIGSGPFWVCEMSTTLARNTFTKPSISWRSRPGASTTRSNGRRARSRWRGPCPMTA